MSADFAAVPCLLIRGGTSKGAYFLESDLPVDLDERNDLLLRIMGSPDSRQIDGLGGAHPLTSKVAIVSKSADPEADVDYTFVQIGVEVPTVVYAQTCGNLLAGVGPFAIERGLVQPTGTETAVRVRSMNPTVEFSTEIIQTPDGRVNYEGNVLIAGVPFPAAPITLELAGSQTPLYPTGHVTDMVGGLEVTLVNAGMPVVIVSAEDLGLIGYETPAELEANLALVSDKEALRLAAGPLMGLGNVDNLTVPKVVLAALPRAGGTISTRVFIPHRVHDAIGVLMAASVAAASRTNNTVANRFAAPGGNRVSVEHPTGTFELEIELETSSEAPAVRRSAVVRSARKIFDGIVFPRQGASDE